MNVATLKTDKYDARNALAEYRAAVKARQEQKPLDDDERRQLQEDEATLKTLNALARGEKVLNLFDVMEAAKCKPDGSPVLAIARATWTHCWCSRVGDMLRFAGTSDTHHRTRHMYVDIPRRRLPGFALPPRVVNWREETWRAVVPQVPPRHRPKRRHLQGYFVLWEAEWQKVPVDPILLRHLTGPLYVVLAAWDLTEVERAVLGLRME